MTINAIIADDHELVREALQVRLQRMDVKIVAEAVNGRQAIDLATSIDFDLILMDISMPIINGVEATQRIKQANPSCKILVLSTHDSQDYIRAVAAAGADGYLLKSADFDEMQRAVQVVAMGGSYFAETIKEKLFGDRAYDDTKHQSLTLREREVLRMMDEGLRSKEIAHRLNISTRTVEAHRRNLKRKLD
jgi:two-component system nitrate/nitrite response regulator NarL